MLTRNSNLCPPCREWLCWVLCGAYGRTRCEQYFSLSHFGLSPHLTSSLATVTAPSPRLCCTPVLVSILIAWPSIVLSIDVLCTELSLSMTEKTGNDTTSMQRQRTNGAHKAWSGSIGKCLISINVHLFPWRIAAVLMPVPECKFPGVYTVFDYSILHHWARRYSCCTLQIGPSRTCSWCLCCLVLLKIHAFHMCEWSNPWCVLIAFARHVLKFLICVVYLSTLFTHWQGCNMVLHG